MQVSAEGFSGVGRKIDKCKDMIQESQTFAENCDGTVASFMGVWDLDSAMGHLVEMMRLLKLGEMVNQFAQEIKKLIRANIAVMEAVMQKIKEIDVIPDNVEDVVASVGKVMDDLDLDGRRIKKFGKKLGGLFN